MIRIFFSFYLSSYNPLMLTNPSNKLYLSCNCCNYSPYMHLFLGSLSKSYWWSVVSHSLSGTWITSSCIYKGPPVGSIWSDALLCLTENCRWSRRTHRLYFPNYFLVGCHPQVGRYYPWYVWVRLGFCPSQKWLLGRIPGWCRRATESLLVAFTAW